MTKGIGKLQKSVLSLFYRNPMPLVAFGLLGDMLLDFVRRGRCQDLLSDMSSFKAVDSDLDDGVDAITRSAYEIRTALLANMPLRDLSVSSELEALLDALHSGLSQLAASGECVRDSIRLMAEPAGGTNSNVAFTFVYLGKTDV